MKTSRLRLVTTAAALLSFSGFAHAHFLWVHLVQRDATRAVEIVLSDGPYTDTARPLVNYIEGLEAHTPGDASALPLAATDWGLEASLTADARLVTARKSMGLFSPPTGAPPHRLEYFAKGALDLKSAGTRVGQPMEVVLRAEGDALVATTWFEGAPAVGAQLQIGIQGTEHKELRETDAEGQVRFPRPNSGLLALRSRVEVFEDGVIDETPYDKIHFYATLCVAGLARTPQPEAELDGRMRLEDAFARVAELPEDVGLAGVLSINVDGKRLRGEFDALQGELSELLLPGAAPEVVALVEAELTDLLDARRPRTLEARYPDAKIVAAPRDGDPLGRGIRVDNGREHFRIEERLVRSHVARRSNRLHETLVLGFEELEDGRCLPNHVARTVRDAPTGMLLETHLVSDLFREEEGAGWIPTRRQVVRIVGSQRTVLVLELRNLEIFTDADG